MENIQTIKDFGEVNKYNELEHVFTTNKKIKSIKPDCGCTSITSKEYNFTIKYKVAPIPYHLSSNGTTRQNRIKGVTVTYNDDSTQRFLIKMTIV